MGRKRLWEIKTLNRQEIDARARFIEALHRLVTTSNIRERLRQDWDLFLVMNNLQPCPRTLELFIADLSLSLKATTAYEYTSKLSYLPCMKLPGMRPTLMTLMRLLNIRAADEEVRKALDISHGMAERIIRTVEDREARFALSVMALLGPRAQDVRWLRTKQLDIPRLSTRRRFPKRFYRAQIRVAKNRKELGKRVNLYVPAEMRAPLRRTANALSKFLRRQDPEAKIFAKCTAARLNSILRAVCLDLGVPRVTTYSFRRLYVSEAIRYCNRDFSMARNLTLHFAEDTIRSYYDQW